MTLTGGSTNISGNGFFDSDGLVTLNGGSINLSDVGLVSTSANYTQGGGTVNMHSGGLFVNEVGAQTANLGGGTFRVHAGGRATNNADINNLGGIANNGVDLIVDGGGVLDGTGNFVQNAGTTTINGQMIQTGVTINAGTLGASATIRSNVINTGGTLGPGNSPGTLAVDGDFVQGPGGTVAIEINSLSLLDILAIEGAATLVGVLDLTVDAGYAATAQEGDLFTIIESTSYSGAFATVTGLSFGDGLYFTLDYGAAGLTLMVNAQQVAEVSEPGTIALFCIAPAGMGVERRRRG